MNVIFRQEQLKVQLGKYPNGNTRLNLINPKTFEPVATCSIPVKEQLPKHIVIIKNYAENSGILPILIADGVLNFGVVKPTGYKQTSQCLLSSQLINQENNLGLSLEHTDIIDLMTANPAITNQEIGYKLSWSTPTIRNRIMETYRILDFNEYGSRNRKRLIKFFIGE